MSNVNFNAVTTPNAPPAGKVTAFSDSNDLNRIKARYPDGRVEVISRRSVARNFLINGGFRFAQRQAPATATAVATTLNRTYAPDRWGLSPNGNVVNYQRVDSMLLPQTNLTARYFGQIVQTAGAGHTILSQVLEGDDAAALRGSTVRFQIKMKWSVSSIAFMRVRIGVLYLTSAGTVDSIPASFYTSWPSAQMTDPLWGTNLVALAPSNPDGGVVNGLGMDCILSTNWQRFSATFTIPTNAQNIIVVAWNDTMLAVNDQWNFSEAGLYDGQEIIDWSPVPVDRELTRCQRFYQKTFGVDTAPAAGVGINTGEWKFAAAIAGAAAQRAPSVEFSARMYAIPNVTTFNPATAANSQPRDETAGADCTGISTAAKDENVLIAFTGAAGTTVGGIIGIHLTMSAEI
jgi:hypothetical protein